ncbi:lysophospholipid acyltransferase family protein [Puniceicoccales bacterium CK1056]|uniref:Lysophospholipid acyltransferase family protein n=1 Tax=Oceanipulchritudo coccoides TaxID=2706888 RepID=A0A6B2LZ74_9BACT|nr:lysophospholipid acyltransferase family protein [Oceanipulchritudo coccoides]NDV61349.1 lysophospholipid acyltransferase family protein [Oceanipulchritudo coccoides]
MSETANSSPKIHSVSGLQRVLLAAFAWCLRKWMKTLEFEDLVSLNRVVNKAPTGTIFLLWHNRLFPLMSALVRVGVEGREFHGLVSASRDGGQLSYFMESIGVKPIRGSSSRRGAVAARELLKVLNKGHHIAITIDGPRGPCYEAQLGASLLVQLTGAPVVLLGAECESCRSLRSWDRFIIPRPFSRVKIKMDHLALDSRETGKEQRKVIQQLIQKQLSGLTSDLHRNA